MKRLLIIGALALALTGCAATGPIDMAQPSVCQPVEVKVPIPIPPAAPPTVVRPSLPINNLKKNDSPAKVAKAYKATVKALEGYSAELELIIDGYRVKSAVPTPNLPTVEEAPRPALPASDASATQVTK